MACCSRAARRGQDFLFWYWYTQSLKEFLRKDQYLPALRWRREQKLYAYYPAGWEFLADEYETLLTEATERMPPSAAPGFDAPTVLRHCAEVLLRKAAGQARLPQAALKKLGGAWLAAAGGPVTGHPWQRAAAPELVQQWTQWWRRVAGAGGARTFQLALHLHEPEADPESPAATPAEPPWRLEFRVWSRRDPSLQLALADYWPLLNEERALLRREFGEDFEAALLADLGHAERIYPPLWEALDTAEPAGMTLSLEAAFAFLTETSWVLEEAGFRVIVPAWWTPRGRRRARLRMRAAPSGKKAGAAAKTKGLNLAELLNYRYDLTLGGEMVDPEEWRQLVEAKTPLVQFRGQWVVLDKDRMAEMLAFWKQQGETGETLDLQGLLRQTADEDGVFEVDPGDALATMLAKLRDPGHLEPVGNPPGLKAELREYQQRGVAPGWHSSNRWASAAVWPTTWAWARPFRSSPGCCMNKPSMTAGRRRC